MDDIEPPSSNQRGFLKVSIEEIAGNQLVVFTMGRSLEPKKPSSRIMRDSLFSPI